MFKWKHARRLLCGYIVALIVFPLFLVNAPDALADVIEGSSRITIFSQYAKKNGSYVYASSKFYLRDGEQTTESSLNWSGPACLMQGGCCLFSYAHAIQWVTGQKAGDSLLTDLIGYCCSPSNTHGHNYKGCKNAQYSHSGTGEKSFTAYSKYAQSKGIQSEVYSSDKSLTKDTLRPMFNDGKVFIVHVTNHYVCAVDYVICDSNLNIIDDDGVTTPSGGDMYIQIIDSASRSSTKSGRTFYGKAYTLDSSKKKLVSHGVYSFGTGNSYWVKVNSLTVHAWLKNNWPGHRKASTHISDLDAYYTLNGVTLNAGTDAGSSILDGASAIYSAINVNTYTTPDSNGTVKATKTGATVFHAVELVKNSKNEEWLKLDDGSYIIKSDFTEQYRIVDIPKGAGNYVVSEPNQTQWGKYPFDAQNHGTTLKNGTVVYVARAARNNKESLWFEIESAGSNKWVYSSHLTFKEAVVTIALKVPDEDRTTNLPKSSGNGIPSGKMKKASSFPLKGNIIVSENITSVVAKIINLGTNKEVLTVTDTPNALTYDIRENKVNTNMKFGSLPDGVYRYTVDIKTASGKTASVIDSVFTWGDPTNTKVPAIRIDLECYDTPIYDGQNEGYSFIGSSKNVAAYVFPDEASQTVTWSSSDPSVATVNNGHVECVGVGSAVITCSTTDGSGVKISFTENVRCEHPSASWYGADGWDYLICDVCREQLDRKPWTVYVTGYEYMPEGSGMTVAYQEQAGFWVRTLPDNASNRSFTAVSQDESIIRIDQINNGETWDCVVFTAVGIGTTSVKIYSQDGSNVTGSMLITVEPPPISDPGQLTVTASDIQANGTFTVNYSIKDNPGYSSLALGFKLGNNSGTLQEARIMGEITENKDYFAIHKVNNLVNDDELGTLTILVDDPSKDTTLTIERLESFDMYGRETVIRLPSTIQVKGYKAPVTPGQLTVSASDIQADGTFTVDLGITNNPGFSAMTIGYKIDNNSGGIKRADLIGMVADANTTVGDYVRIWKTTDIVGNGEFASITFAVDDPSKDTTISIQILEMVDAYGRKVPINVPGPIQVKGYKAPAPVYSAQLTASASTMQADGTFTVTLGIKNNPGFSSIQIASDYEAKGFSLISATGSGIASGQDVILPGSFFGMYTVNENGFVGDGSFMQIVLRGNSQNSSATIAFSCEEAGKSDGTPISVSSTSVSIESARLPGDANGDGKITMVDAMLTARKACGHSINLYTSNADVNQDGKITMVDAMLIARRACGHNVDLK